MKQTFLLLIILFPLAVIGQGTYPFENTGQNEDLLAYWYNVPKDSVHVKMMNATIHFFSTLELYGKVNSNSFTLGVEAWQESIKVFDEQFVITDRKADKDCRLSFTNGCFKLVYPVQVVDKKPDRITLTIAEGDIKRSRDINCTYHNLSGRIYDFEGNPFRAFVSVRPDDFNFSTSIWSDSSGYYNIELPERTYNDIAVANENYGIDVLEAWAWHTILDADTKMDYKIGSGEVYNLHAWPNNGGGNTYFVFFRPMSLHTFSQKDNVQATAVKGKTFNVSSGISLTPDDIKVFVNGKESRIVSLQTFYETHDDENASEAYLLQIDRSGLKRTGKQELLLEFLTREETQGKVIIHSGQGYYQFYTNFAGLSNYY